MIIKKIFLGIFFCLVVWTGTFYSIKTIQDFIINPSLAQECASIKGKVNNAKGYIIAKTKSEEERIQQINRQCITNIHTLEKIALIASIIPTIMLTNHFAKNKSNDLFTRRSSETSVQSVIK